MNVLLVEDNSADAYLLTEFLGERDSLPLLRRVNDGSEALDYVYQRNGFDGEAQPDLIILDLGLPRLSGYDVLKQLKEDEKVAGIPVIVLTTSQNPIDEAHCVRLGADAFFSKPYSVEGYEELINQLVRVEFPRLMAKRSKPN